MIASWKHSMSAAAAAALTLSSALAQPAASPPPAPGYTMPSTQVWDLAADSGEVYRIFVSYPAGDPPERGWPVLYVLDGNAAFAGFAEARRVQEWKDAGKSIVVGVGYQTDLAYDKRRLYDLTAGPTDAAFYAKLNEERSGGWDKFLDFLTGKLRAELGKRHRIDLDRQALFGHSLGGLFAVHTLFTRPGAFHAIIAASPSLFWHEQLMRKEEREFTERLRAGKISKVSRLLVVAGGQDETALEVWDPEDFAKRMEPLSAYGLRSRSIVYPEEGHMTVPARAVTDTLRFASTWP